MHKIFAQTLHVRCEKALMEDFETPNLGENVLIRETCPTIMSDIPILHARLQVEMSMNWPQPLDNVNTQPLEHLEDNKFKCKFSCFKVNLKTNFH